MYNPSPAGTPSSAASPPPPPPPEEFSAAPRYTYLVSRLRNRQITMEEATELFAIQQRQVSALLARTNALAAAAAVPRPAARPMAPPSPTAPPAVQAFEGLDPWGEGLLFLALGAGLFAALAKRAREPEPAPPSRPPPAAPASRRR